MIDNSRTTDATEEATVCEDAAKRPMRHHRRDPHDDKYFKIRNILNLVFILGSVTGMALFYFYDRTLATIIIVTSMVFKLAECCFRLIRQ